MNEVWKGFAGLVVAFGLAAYIHFWESSTEREHSLVNESDPAQQAEVAFEEFKYTFYRIWNRRADENGRIYGYWLLPGETKIEASILEQYPVRYDFKESKHVGNTHEQVHFWKKAKMWCITYNLRLAELIQESAQQTPDP